MGSLVNYYRPMRIQLGGQPAETLKAEPKYQSRKPLYGILEAGGGFGLFQKACPWSLP